MDEVEATRQPELIAYKMSRCTWAAGTVTIFARMSIDEGDEVLDRVGRQRWIDREHNSRGDRERYRIEIVMRIVGNLVVQAGIDDVVGWNDHHRVTVGCRVCRSGHADIAAGAGYVFDVELFSDLLRQRLCDEAGDYVGRSGGRIGNDHTHRSGWIGLRASETRHRRQRGGARGQMQKSSAGKFHFEPPSHCERWPGTPITSDGGCSPSP